MTVPATFVAACARDAGSVVLGVAALLHCNGQATDETVHAVGRLSRELGLEGELLASWDRVELLTAEEDGPSVIIHQAVPTAMKVNRVSAAMSAIEALLAKEIDVEQAQGRFVDAGRMGPLPLWVFAGAAGCGRLRLGGHLRRVQAFSPCRPSRPRRVSADS